MRAWYAAVPPTEGATPHKHSGSAGGTAEASLERRQGVGKSAVGDVVLLTWGDAGRLGTPSSVSSRR